MSDYTTFCTKDERLQVRSSLPYAVYQGGQNVTFSQVKATSASTSQHVFNVIVPSQNVVVDRKIHWECSIKFSFQLTQNAGDAGNADLRAVWAKTVGMCAFPLNQLTTTMTATINNNSVSVQSREIMPFLLKLFTREELSHYQNTTLALPDNFQKFQTQVNGSSNVLAGVENQTLDDMNGRGSYKLDYFNTVGDENLTNSTRWQVDNAVADAPRIFYGQITVSEPLFCSPFIFTKFAKNQAGIYGINNMNIVMNMGDPTPTLLKFPYYQLNAGSSKVSNIQVKYENSSLRLQYLTPKPSMMLSARNIVPYYTLNRFNYACGAVGPATASTQSNNLVSPSSWEVSSNTINIQSIPDKFIIGVRATQQFYSKAKGCQFGQFFMPIDKITVNFNNSSGLLASACPQQLWTMSVDNGNRQNYVEWSGIGNFTSSGLAANTGCEQVALNGGFLVLAPARDIQLTEEYLSNGSIGNYQIQVIVNFLNYSLESFASGDLELVIIPVQSGLFVLEKGSSSVYTALLDKETVLNAIQKPAVYSETTNRQIGGNFFDDIKSGMSEVASFVRPIADIVKPVSDIVSAIGSGASGGGESGGRKMMRHRK
jgi:hypothetical protein